MSNCTTTDGGVWCIAKGLSMFLRLTKIGFGYPKGLPNTQNTFKRVF